MTTLAPSSRRPPLTHGEPLPCVGGPLAGTAHAVVLVWDVPQPLFISGEFDVYDLDRMKRRWVWRQNGAAAVNRVVYTAMPRIR